MRRSSADSKASPAVLVPVLELYKRKRESASSPLLTRESWTSACKQPTNAFWKLHHRGKRACFRVESLRWIVERTRAWLDNARVLCRDYEVLPENHEGMICVVMIRLMLRRLGNNRRTRTYKTA